MIDTVAGHFPLTERLANMVRALKRLGVRENDISVVPGLRGYSRHGGFLSGMVLGGSVGLVVGSLPIAGRGSRQSFSPSLGAISGAFLGAIAGALVDYGLSRLRAEGKYHRLVRGRMLIAVRTRRAAEVVTACNNSAIPYKNGVLFV